MYMSDLKYREINTFKISLGGAEGVFHLSALREDSLSTLPSTPQSSRSGRSSFRSGKVTLKPLLSPKRKGKSPLREES